MNTQPLKLFSILLGGQPKGRLVEQHDYYFGIAAKLEDLAEDLKAFWPEAGKSLHIDAWREVTYVDGYRINIASRDMGGNKPEQKVFFINLGGYLPGNFQETHKVVLTVQDSITSAIRNAKQTSFFKNNSVKDSKGANSHIDEKYGLDIDDIYNIEDILPVKHKTLYEITLEKTNEITEDEIHLGYLKLEKLTKNSSI